MNDFDKKLDFDSNTFENMKHDMNFVLQRLLGNMIEKQSNEGSMTIKIDVTMVKEFIPKMCIRDRFHLHSLLLDRQRYSTRFLPRAHLQYDLCEHLCRILLHLSLDARYTFHHTL